MNPWDPFNLFHLSGEGLMRNVTIALPTEQVRSFLPAGLELGSQSMTEAGTHPVVMGFHNMYNLRGSIPSLLPQMTYCEHSVGIPYCYVSYGIRLNQFCPGPYFYMPKLFVDSTLAMLGGRLFWGFDKVMAGFGADPTHLTAYQKDGQPIVSLQYELEGKLEPTDHFADFEMQKEAITQPLVSSVPLGIGPWFVVAGFPKIWQQARMQPLRGVVDIHKEYVPGLSPGRYPVQGSYPGINKSPTGGYALHAPFEVGSPYLPLPNLAIPNAA